MTENGMETIEVPALAMDVSGEYQRAAYPMSEEFTVHLVRTDEDHFTMTTETSEGTVIWRRVLGRAAADGISRMASTDHSLAPYRDDWVIPAGMDRSITWDVSDDSGYYVMLREHHIDEIAAWLEYATGEKHWLRTFGDTWSY